MKINESAAQDSQILGNKICRERYWDELNDSEKIERMRDEVKRLQNQVKRLSQLTDRLLQHNHSQSGALFVPIEADCGYGQLGLQQQSKQEVRF